MTRKSRSTLLVLFTVLSGIGWGVSIIDTTKTAAQTAPPTPAKVENGVYSIELPSVHVALPEGQGCNQVLSSCCSCHSLRYIEAQPRHPRSIWKKEVAKMVKNYGAEIPDRESAEIVNYLVTHYGRED